jgi:hypothetical protein
MAAATRVNLPVSQPQIALLAAKNRVLYRSRPRFPPGRQSRSSVVEHLLDMEVVGGSIPLATTNFLTDRSVGRGDSARMFKFLGSTIGIIFLIGLVVTILLLKAIF